MAPSTGSDTVQPSSNSRSDSRWKKAIFCAAMLGLMAIFVFGVLEIALRLIADRALKAEKGAPLMQSAVPGLGYQLAPNARGEIETDARGLRLRPADVTPVRYSVLLVGDSVAYGMGVPYAASFVPLLESRLDSGLGEHTAVWNAAVPGYNTVQEAIQLDQMAPITKPNLVIVQFCMNDYQDAPVLTAEGWLDAMQAQNSKSDFSILSLAYRSRVLVFAKEKLRDLEQVHPEWFPVWAHYIHYVQKKPGWERAKEALSRISDTAARHHARLLVVIFPVEQQLRIPDRAAQNDLLAFLGAHGIESLDLYDAFRAHWRDDLYVDYWKRTGVVDKLHLNMRGHALAAAEISRAILSRPQLHAAPSPARALSTPAAAAKTGLLTARFRG